MRNLKIIKSLLNQLKCRVVITEFTYIHGGIGDVRYAIAPKSKKVIYYSDINEMKQALKEFKNNEDIIINDVRYVQNNKSTFN
ncbi:TPA: hypothetical protein PTV74_003228 [Clostridium botulinum]|nr:hypothetical protein [Clostridium botulinum]HDK7206383.1 hypothetical protein [Clostridium botulinum]HDK7210119.1 hypothetical protein [Clostridium botulinum]HDK7265568.1 hypothetical protein [Clostridium botulinum]HDK7269416.1 hypothetical protein [Clostridium botulinum]